MPGTGNLFNETLPFGISGRVQCFDDDTNECISDDTNAVNFENVVGIITALLANESTGPSAISYMAFGNGAASVNALGEIEYKTPNVETSTGTLYNETFAKFVANNPTTDANNNIESSHITGNTYSDIIITCTLERNEPAGQNTIDNAASLNEDFVFDEIGLKNDSNVFLTHYISSPIEKSANRRFRVVYTLRVTTG